MATYNKGPYLRQAIDSIVAQTFTDWELLVADDGSTDDTKRILAGYTDPRIHVLTLATNAGRSWARNLALAQACGRSIAICDSDDLSRPTRLERQVAFLDAHPEIGVVSGYIRAFSDAGESVMMFPLEPSAIHSRFERGKMGAAHGAAMVRRVCFDRLGGYINDLSYAEDFELFTRFSREYAFQSLPEVLLDYRHELGVGSIRQWAADGRAHRYALYRSRRPSIGQRVVTLEEFSSRWQTRLCVYTVDLLRSVLFTTRSRLFSEYVLR
jgi:glycosyltransferase involved in cell wall biosynthesis